MTAPQLTDKDGAEIRKGRVSPALRTAIVLLVEEGLTIPEAAQRIGYKGESLAKALAKPHVRALRADVKAAWMTNQTSRAWLTVAGLASGAQSEDVRLKACRTILEAAGELGRAEDDARGAARTLINIIQSAEVTAPTESRPGVIEIRAARAEVREIVDDAFEQASAHRATGASRVIAQG